MKQWLGYKEWLRHRGNWAKKEGKKEGKGEVSTSLHHYRITVAQLFTCMAVALSMFFSLVLIRPHRTRTRTPAVYWYGKARAKIRMVKSCSILIVL